MATVKVMISVSEDLLVEIDRAAAGQHRSRSEFLREAARDYIARHTRSHVPGDDLAIRAAHEAMLELAQRAGKRPGPTSVELVRRWRDRQNAEQVGA